MKTVDHVAAVELLGDLQAAGEIFGPLRKRFNPLVALPLVQAVLQVGLQTVGSLVAIFGVLGQQCEDNV